MGVGNAAKRKPQLQPIKPAPSKTPSVTGAERKKNKATFGAMQTLLQQYGLGELFSYNDGKPSGWLWEQITMGHITDETTLGLYLEETTPFKEKYGIIFDLRKLAQTDPSIIPMSVQQVAEYRQQVARSMRSASLPGWLYDDHKDFDKLLRNGLDAEEVEQRIDNALTLAKDQGPEVRAAFSKFFGIGNGDAALAAAILDPEKGQKAIERRARMAYAAGIAQQSGFELTKRDANRVARQGISEVGLQEQMQKVGGMADLANEGIGETSNITTSDLLDSQVFGDADTTRRLEQRLAARKANDSASVGGAVQTQRGFTGFESV